MSPAEIKGVAALTHESPGSSDDNWLYLPANKRVRRISGANNTASFQGTEFTYEDLSNLDPREYEWRFVEEATIEREGAETVPVSSWTPSPPTRTRATPSIVVYYHRDGFWRQERIEYLRQGRPPPEDARDDGLEAGPRPLLAPGPHRDDQPPDGQAHAARAVQKQLPRPLSKYKSSKTGKARSNLTEDVFTTRAWKS